MNPADCWLQPWSELLGGSAQLLCSQLPTALLRSWSFSAAKTEQRFVKARWCPGCETAGTQVAGKALCVLQGPIHGDFSAKTHQLALASGAEQRHYALGSHKIPFCKPLGSLPALCFSVAQSQAAAPLVMPPERINTTFYSSFSLCFIPLALYGGNLPSAVLHIPPEGHGIVECTDWKEPLEVTRSGSTPLQGHPQLEQAAQSPSKPGLERFVFLSVEIFTKRGKMNTI